MNRFRFMFIATVLTVSTPAFADSCTQAHINAASWYDKLIRCIPNLACSTDLLNLYIDGYLEWSGEADTQCQLAE